MKSIKIKRKINSTLLRIKELEKFRGKNVELIININEINSETNVKKSSGLAPWNRKKHSTGLAGVFFKYADKNKTELENDAWAIAVKEKHENYRR